MELSEYQRAAEKADQRERSADTDDDNHLVVPLLGLVGEVGTLHTEYKKLLRDGPRYSGFKRNLAEELGDILWYVANLASKFDLDLDEVAAKNLAKVFDRWPHDGVENARHLPDDDFPSDQQLPRHFEVTFHSIPAPDIREPARVQCFWNDLPFGDTIDDNAEDEDGYRYHDAFHLAYAATLGWSPVARKFFGAKRRGDTDRVLDGGRAKAYEEAISAIVYSGGADADFYRDPEQEVDFSVLKLVKQVAEGLPELRNVTLRDWEQAIVSGFRVWNQLLANEGGLVIGDLRNGTLSYKEIPDTWRPPTTSGDD